jgi:hypothetical protein
VAYFSVLRQCSCPLCGNVWRTSGLYCSYRKVGGSGFNLSCVFLPPPLCGPRFCLKKNPNPKVAQTKEDMEFAYTSPHSFAYFACVLFLKPSYVFHAHKKRTSILKSPFFGGARGFTTYHCTDMTPLFNCYCRISIVFVYF